MPSLNVATIIGHVGKDAEVKSVGGATLASFSVATTEKWKDRNGQPQEHTEWHHVSLWGKPADAIGQYITKGRLVYVAGRIETREVEKDGSKRYYTGIKADRVLLLGKMPGDDARNTRTAGDEADEDIGF